MKKIYAILFLFIFKVGFSQTTIFSENMGSPSSTTPISSNTFQNSSLCFTGTGDVRNTSASSGYSGASGGGNIFLTNTAGKYFQICCISTGTCSTLSLSFGVFKSGASTSTDLQISFSTDGGTTFGTATTVTITGGSGWSQQTISSGIPTGTICIKFNNAGGSQQIRIDDVSLISNCGGGGSILCPQLTGAILNSCNTAPIACNEGDAEAIFLNMGSYSVTVSSLSSYLLTYYGGVSSYTAGTPNGYTGTFSSNSSTTSSLNSSSGCSGSFIDAASAGTIPAYATVMMVPSTFCPSNYDFSTLCSSLNPIYVLYYATSGTGYWNSSGTLSNYQAGSNPKYIVMDFSSVSSSCAANQYYTFDAGSEATGDGASIAFSGAISTNSASPTNPSNYTTAGCTLPIVLPVTFVKFTANRITMDDIMVKWTVAEEINNNYFVLEYSLDGEKFTDYEQIKGAGNSLTTTNYNCLFTEKTENNNPYFRIRQVDFDGKIQYSPVITLNSTNPHSKTVFYYNAQKDKIVARFKLSYPQNVTLSLYTSSGELLYTNQNYFNEGANEYQILSPDKSGVYFMVYQAEDNAPIHRKIMVVK